MTSFEVVTHAFSRTTGSELRMLGGRYRNWPIVYVLDDGRQVYVGETGNVSKRMEQHGSSKGTLKQLRIVLDDRFNKSVCLDLESHLIRYFAGDERLDVLNRNDGITDATTSVGRSIGRRSTTSSRSCERSACSSAASRRSRTVTCSSTPRSRRLRWTSRS